MAVFAEGAEAEEARAAGADIVGGKELIEEIASMYGSVSENNFVHHIVEMHIHLFVFVCMCVIMP